MTTPALSVFMPVYNNADFVSEAIESVLAQNFSDFELVIVDDGSTDTSVEVIRSFRDPRIRLKILQKNRGICGVLPIGWATCSAPVIAKMDADDISLPGRLDAQYKFLQDNPDVDIVGANFEVFGSHAPKAQHQSFPLQPGVVSFGMYFRNCLMEPVMCGRRQVLTSLTYDDEYRYAEEYEAHLRHEVRIANLSDVLLKKRDHGRNASLVYASLSNSNAFRARHYAWERLLGRTLQPELIKSITSRKSRQTRYCREAVNLVAELREKFLAHSLLKPDESQVVREEAKLIIDNLKSMKLHVRAMRQIRRLTQKFNGNTSL